MSPKTARVLLQLPATATATATDVERSFRRLARRFHPDRGGDAEAFRRLMEARAVLRRLDEPPQPPRAPLIVVHRGPWWRRLTRALIDALDRRRRPRWPPVR